MQSVFVLFFVSVIGSAVSEISRFARFYAKSGFSAIATYKTYVFSKSPRCPIFKFFVVILYIIVENLAPMPAPVNLFSILRPLKELCAGRGPSEGPPV